MASEQGSDSKARKPAEREEEHILSRPTAVGELSAPRDKRKTLSHGSPLADVAQEADATGDADASQKVDARAEANATQEIDAPQASDAEADAQASDAEADAGEVSTGREHHTLSLHQPPTPQQEPAAPEAPEAPAIQASFPINDTLSDEQALESPYAAALSQEEDEPASSAPLEAAVDNDQHEAPAAAASVSRKNDHTLVGKSAQSTLDSSAFADDAPALQEAMPPAQSPSAASHARQAALSSEEERSEAWGELEVLMEYDPDEAKHKLELLGASSEDSEQIQLWRQRIEARDRLSSPLSKPANNIAHGIGRMKGLSRYDPPRALLQLDLLVEAYGMQGTLQPWQRKLERYRSVLKILFPDHKASALAAQAAPQQPHKRRETSLREAKSPRDIKRFLDKAQEQEARDAQHAQARQAEQRKSASQGVQSSKAKPREAVAKPPAPLENRRKRQECRVFPVAIEPPPSSTSQDAPQKRQAKQRNEDAPLPASQAHNAHATSRARKQQSRKGRSLWHLSPTTAFVFRLIGVIVLSVSLGVFIGFQGMLWQRFERLTQKVDALSAKSSLLAKQSKTPTQPKQAKPSEATPPVQRSQEPAAPVIPRTAPVQPPAPATVAPIAPAPAAPAVPPVAPVVPPNTLHPPSPTNPWAGTPPAAPTAPSTPPANPPASPTPTVPDPPARRKVERLSVPRAAPAKPRVRKKRPRPRPTAFGYLLIDTDIRADVSIDDDVHYFPVPMLSKKRVGAGWHNLLFIWSPNRSLRKRVFVPANKTKQIYIKLNR